MIQRSAPLEWWRPDTPAETAVPRRTASNAVTRAGEMPFWALMTFTAILLLSPQAYFPVLATLRIALLTATVTAAAYLWACLVYRRPLTVWFREIWLAASLLAWALFMIPFSYSPGGSLSFIFASYVNSLLVFWLLANLVTSVKKLRSIAWELSLVAIPLAATAVYNFYSGEATAKERIAGYEGALAGNPNDLALMINLILPFSVALFLVHRRPAARFLLIASICLSIAAVILTFSRGGFVTLATIFLVYLWKFRRRPERRWTWILFAILLASIPIAAPQYLERLSTITDIKADETGSAQQRWDDMRAAFEFTLQQPITGAGIDQGLSAIREIRGPKGYLVHNVYLEHAVELGLPGLALFVMLLVGAIKSSGAVQRASKEAPERELFYLAEGIQTSLIGFAVACMFHPVSYQVYFYYIAGLAVAAKAVYGRTVDSSDHVNHGRPAHQAA
jgi:O-antigen ligase